MNVVPDTNVWIRWFRERALPEPEADEPRPRVLVATVVLQELWAGVQDDAQARDLRRLYRLARASRTLLNPPAAAWVLSGRALGVLRSRRRLGPQRLRALRNDALVAATAFVVDARVLTENERDFELLREALAVAVGKLRA